MTTDLRDKTVGELHDYASQGTYASARPIVVEVIKEFKRRLAEAEQKIAERDAMLSRCLIYLERTEDGQKFIESLPASAKANAEVLRAASKVEARYVGLSLEQMKDMYTDEWCDLVKAVRAAKESK